MHQILGLKLHRSSFEIVTISLDNSKRCTLKNQEIKVDDSELDIYAKRIKFGEKFRNLNLVQFFRKYEVNATNIMPRKKLTVVRTLPIYSSNPKSPKFGQFCKYQLIKYKPWENTPGNAWLCEEESDQMFVAKWRTYLESTEGEMLVTNWKRALDDVYKYENCDNDVDLVDTEEIELEEWMQISRLVGSTNSITADIDINDIEQMRANLSVEQINSLPFWLENVKKTEFHSYSARAIVNIADLNRKQLLAYKIVENHFLNNSSEPLKLMITGQGGSGKSFVINAVRQLLGNCCIVSSYFGIASFNIGGITLHSLLKLPIRGQNCCELKGQALSNLQTRLQGVRYLLIDEFSVMGQNMFGWIDRRLRQATGKFDLQFGGISIILVGDFAQLPPVSDKPLYSSMPSGNTALMGYLGYRSITTVVKLTENQRVASIDQQKFRDFLLRLRNGDT